MYVVTKQAGASGASGGVAAPGLNNGQGFDPNNPVSGVFGSGRQKWFTASGTFTIPAGCTSVRVRVWSPGGGDTAGGTTSFGAYCSATGGEAVLPSGSTARVGGVPTGFDTGYNGGGSNLGGGGAAANIFGSGDAVGGKGAEEGNGASGVSGRGGNGGSRQEETPGGNGETGRVDALDFLGTGGGGAAGGTGREGGNGSNGGGGAKGAVAATTAGRGGFPGGAKGAPAGGQGGGGGAFGIKTISGLTPGANVTVTVPAAPAGAGGGLIIVEW